MGIFGNDDPEPVEVRGQPMRCVVCQNATFHQRDAQLHGRLVTFFNVEWASPTCTCVICSACGYVHWFLPTS